VTPRIPAESYPVLGPVSLNVNCIFIINFSNDHTKPTSRGINVKAILHSAVIVKIIFHPHRPKHHFPLGSPAFPKTYKS